MFDPSWTDENVHLYVAKKVLDGARLYQDVHSSRPPLVIYILSFFLFLFRDPFVSARVANFFINASTAYVLFLSGRHLRDKNLGLLALAFFIINPLLWANLQYTGINLVAFLSLLSFYCLYVKRRKLFSVGSLALLPLAGQHGAIFFLLSLRKRNIFLALFLPFIVYVLLFWASKGGVWEDLVSHHLYHFQHQNHLAPKVTNLGWWMKTWFFDQAFFLVLILLGLKKIFKAPNFIKLSLFAIMLHMALVSLMRDGLILYFFPCVPFIALLSAYAFDKDKKKVLTAVLVGLAGIYFTNRLFEERDQKDYSLIPYVRFSQMEKVSFPQVALDIAKIIPDKSHIFGHPTIACLIALLTNSEISTTRPDLDPYWLEVNLISNRSVIEELEKNNNDYFITPNWYFLHQRDWVNYLHRSYRAPVIFERVEGSGIPRMFLFGHR